MVIFYSQWLRTRKNCRIDNDTNVSKMRGGRNRAYITLYRITKPVAIAAVIKIVREELVKPTAYLDD